MEERESLRTAGGNIRGTDSTGNNMGALKNLKAELLYNLEILFLGIYTKRWIIFLQRRICASLKFNIALFTVAKI